MSYSTYWITIPVAQVDAARSLATQLGWPNTFTVPLSTDGLEPATHCASHGQIVATEAARLGVDLVPTGETDPETGEPLYHSVVKEPEPGRTYPPTSVELLQPFVASHGLDVEFIPSNLDDPRGALLAATGLRIIEPPAEPE